MAWPVYGAEARTANEESLPGVWAATDCPFAAANVATDQTKTLVMSFNVAGSNRSQHGIADSRTRLQLLNTGNRGIAFVE